MPPPASFDYYAQLGVERTASEQEITSCYRRLARIHHPDKNPDNIEEATATFQKLQEAHETLSDPAKRRQYDFAQSHYSQTEQRPYPYSASDEDDQLYDHWRDDEFYNFFLFNLFDNAFRFTPGGARFYQFNQEAGRFPFEQGRNYPFATEEERRQRNERVKKEAVARAAERAAKEADDMDRRKAEKEIEDEARQRDRKHRLGQEKQKQEARWERFHAVTKDEKLAYCLHSAFCTKIQQKKKSKCGACNAKRGMTVFECPFCAAFLCQLCVANSALKRAQDEKCDRRGPENQAPGKPDSISRKPYSEPTLDKEETKPSKRQARDGKGQCQNRKTTNKRNWVCFNCGQPGHLVRDCPETRA